MRFEFVQTYTCNDYHFRGIVLQKPSSRLLSFSTFLVSSTSTTSTSLTLFVQVAKVTNIMNNSMILPVELWMKVLECLPVSTLCNTMPLVCWDLWYASMDEALWKKLYQNHFQVVIISHRDHPSAGDWRHRYLERKNMVAAKGLVEFSELLKTLLRDPYAFGRNNVMHMYTIVFHFCISNYRIRDYGINHLGLYQLLVDTCMNQLDEACNEAAMMPVGEVLLDYYINAWDRFQNVLKRFNTIFAYFQRDYRHRQDRDGDMFERMVNAYVANKNWQSNVVLGITPMMIVNWIKKFFSPLQQSLSLSLELSPHTPTSKKAISCFMDLVQLTQCQSIPQDICREVMSKLGFLVEGGKVEVEEMEGIEMVGGWMPASGVAVQ